MNLHKHVKTFAQALRLEKKKFERPRGQKYSELKVM